MSALKFTIATPEKPVLQTEAEQVSLPTLMGEITVLPGHIPLVGILKTGTLSFKQEGKEKFLAVSGGFFKAGENSLSVLADSAEHGEELNLSLIEEAKLRAEKAIEEARDKEDVDYSGLLANLERETVRLKTYHKHHTHHRVDLE